jgi:hypothetical protein
MKIAHLALTAVLGASALAFAAHAQPAPVEETVVPRPERVCLYVNQIRNTTAVSDREILFRMDNGRTWKNTLRRACYGLRMRNGISWNIGGDGRVCSNQQVFYVLDYGTPCFLGDFTPYDPAAEEAKAGG